MLCRRGVRFRGRYRWEIFFVFLDRNLKSEINTVIDD